jgi:UDP-3-O-[3-hydroxymyristoyl] glucosamine N-acyltransferase
VTNPKKNLILAGGGGFSLEIYSYLLDEINKNTLVDIKIKGVLDSIRECELRQYHPEVDYLGDIHSYIVKEGDFALIASGNSISRRDIAIQLTKLSLPLYSYIHSSAYVSLNAVLGKGVFVGPHSIVSAHSYISDNVALNVYSGVGHGAIIGPHCVMSPYSVINGDCELGEAVFLGSRVTLNPKMKVGSFSQIDAGCILREPIDEFTLVSQRVEQKVFDNRILRRKILS